MANTGKPTPAPPLRATGVPAKPAKMKTSTLLESVPGWVLHTLPANATSDEELEREIHKLSRDLTGNLPQILRQLNKAQADRHYDSAANLASAHVWMQLDQLCAADSSDVRSSLLLFIPHMTSAFRARVLRRLVKDREVHVRRWAAKVVAKSRLREVALPDDPGGTWDTSGWSHGVSSRRLFGHRQGRRVQEKQGVSPIGNVAELRELLGICSKRQLGYLLLASDNQNGPYTRFTVSKRGGGQREICAPGGTLKYVQRQILDKILAPIPIHNAAHGFVRGRSTVTNATPHLKSQVILKFDLRDFFPTIHHFRVVGLFASLGYTLDDGRFGTDDSSRQVAATLARLCIYTPKPGFSAEGILPQGAPTSPAISNLICRRLDARLAGLARRNQAAFTRYADDLTFSFSSEECDFGRFRWWVDQICHQEGFMVNQRKFRVIRRSQRQSVTGIVVNDELRLPRRERRRLRAILHNCRRFGVSSQARGNPAFLEHLRGLASYLQMVQPEEGAEVARQIEDICDSTLDG